MADTCIVGCFPPLADDVCEAARAAGLNAVGTGGTLEAVLRLARKRLPGVLLLHALLPGLDASRIEATLDEMALYRRPAIVYMVPEGATEKNTPLSRELRTLFPSVSARPSSDEIRFAAEEARRARAIRETVDRLLAKRCIRQRDAADQSAVKITVRVENGVRIETRR